MKCPKPLSGVQILVIIDSDSDIDTENLPKSILILIPGKVRISIPIPILIPKSNKFYNIDFDEMPKIIEWGTRF